MYQGSKRTHNGPISYKYFSINCINYINSAEYWSWYICISANTVKYIIFNNHIISSPHIMDSSQNNKKSQISFLDTEKDHVPFLRI